MELLTLAPGSDKIPVELFQILKDDAVESAALSMQYAICTQHAICWLPALGDLVFLGVKGLVVPEADEMRAPFKLGPRFFKADGIWGLSSWNLKPSG